LITPFCFFPRRAAQHVHDAAARAPHPTIVVVGRGVAAAEPRRPRHPGQAGSNAREERRRKDHDHGPDGKGMHTGHMHILEPGVQPHRNTR
jgi:hypothetical protein